MSKITNQPKVPIASAEDIDYSTIPQQRRWEMVQYITVGLGLSALVSIFIVVADFVGPGGSGEGIFAGLVVIIVFINKLLVLPLIIVTLVAGVVMMLTARDFMSKYLLPFTKSNGFMLQPNSFAINKDGSIFGFGNTPSEKNIITGEYRGFDFELYEHSYWTGTGRSRSQHRLSILNLKLPKKVPHLVVDSRVEGSSRYGGSVLPIDFDYKQKLTLEGDFSKYFNVYSPHNYQVSALSLLTPDVMQMFLAKLHRVDVELVNNRLYIYAPDVMNSSEQIANMFKAADAIIDEWGDKLRRADIYATKQQEALNTSTGASPVRLKRGSLIAGIVVIVVFMLFQIVSILSKFIDSPVFMAPVYLILPAALVVAIVGLVISVRRRMSFTKRYGRRRD